LFHIFVIFLQVSMDFRSLYEFSRIFKENKKSKIHEQCWAISGARHRPAGLAQQPFWPGWSAPDGAVTVGNPSDEV
jgi:hypothetical protein